MIENSFNKNSKKIFLLLITVLVFSFSVINLLWGYSLVGKTFSGFGTGITLFLSPKTQNAWTGSSSGFDTYDRIVKVNGVKIVSIEEFDKIIQATVPGTPVSYSYIKATDSKYWNTFDEKISDESLHQTSVKTMNFSLNVFIETYLMEFVISMFFLLIGIFIIFNYHENDEKIKTLLLFIIMFSTSMVSLRDQEFNHKFVHFAYIVNVFTIAALVHLGVLLNKSNKKFFKILSGINLATATIISFVLIITSSIIKDNIYYHPFALKCYFTFFYSFAYYSGAGFLTFALLIFYSYFKSPVHSIEKVQNRIIMTGSILAFFPIVIFWAIPLVFGYKASLENTFVFFIALPVFITYSIVRYKAFDIEIFIRKSLVYATLSAILVLGYFVFSTIGFVILKNILNLNDEVYIAVSAIIATIITGRISNSVQNIIDKTFYRHRLNLTIMLEDFINEVTNVFDKNDLLSKALLYLEKTISPQFVAVYTKDITTNSLLLLGTNNDSLPEEITNFPAKYDSFNINKGLLLPLEKEKNIIGFLLLGEKKSETEYFFEEKNFLKNFTASLSMALNSLLLKDEAFSLTLKNMELENKTHFLNQLTSNLSHDLKFPLTSAYSVVNNIKYILEKKPTVSKDFIEGKLDNLYKSLKKIGEYISISLDRELISLGKLVLKNELVDVKQSCNDAVFLHSNSIEKEGLSVNLDFPENEDLFIMGDSIRFESVISNLISNAIKYGGDSISIKLKKSDNSVCFQISDNGPGIETELRDHAFECYVKGDKNSGINSGKERSTGLGLFICKTYIEMMKGEIWFESEINKGTTFFIKMPFSSESDSLHS